MELTEEGKLLLERVSGLVRQIEVSVNDVQSMRSEVKGSVAQGLTPSVTTVLAVRLVQRVARELPGVALRIAEGSSVHLLEWLQRGDIDLALLSGSTNEFHLRTRDLLHEDIVLISPPGSLNGIGDCIRLEQAVSLPLALTSSTDAFRLIIEAAVKRAGVSLQIVYEVDSFWIIHSLVKTGSGRKCAVSQSGSDSFVFTLRSVTYRFSHFLVRNGAGHNSLRLRGDFSKREKISKTG